MSVRTVALFLAVVLAVSACGAADAAGGGESLNSSDGVASVAGTETDTESDQAAEPADDEVDTEAQLLAFAECIRNEGFELADPTVDADGNVILPRPAGGTDGQGPPSGFAEARDACAEHLDGVSLGFREGDQTERQDQLLKFATCMRDNGYDLPDPNFSEEGGRGLLQEVDQNDPAYQAAFAECDDILGGFGQGGGRGGN